MNIKELLKNKYTTELEWVEPWLATGPGETDISAHITLRATVHDCVNLARFVAKANGRPTAGNDAELLQEFIAVNWAVVYHSDEGNTRVKGHGVYNDQL